MCKHCSLVPILRLVALVLLAVAVAACLVGFVSPFWAYYDPGLPCRAPPPPPPAGNATTAAPGPATTTTAGPPPLAAEIEGLWGRCAATNYTLCTWFWDDNFKLERCFPSTNLPVLYILKSTQCITMNPPSRYYLYNSVRKEPILIIFGTRHLTLVLMQLSTTHEKCHHIPCKILNVFTFV